MVKNKIFSIKQQLQGYVHKPVPGNGTAKLRHGKRKLTNTADKYSRQKSRYSFSHDTEKTSETVVGDDVFVVDILEYFFGKRLRENQLTKELREMAATCLWEAIKASRTMDLVPRPPKGVPSPAWVVQEAVQIAYRRARNKGIYEAVKNTVTLKWRSAFQVAVMESEAGIAQSVLTQAMMVNNSALVVFLENTGALPFQWESRIGRLVQEGLEKVIDYVSEEFSKWLNKFADAKGKKYKEVIILEDAKATYANLKSTLHDLAKREFIIDVFTLAHGDSSSFSGYKGASITGADLKAIKDTYGKPLPLRIVYMMNCKGGGLNDEWLYVGAKATAGSIQNNYIPEPMMSKFWHNWLRGDSFTTAVNTAYDDSVKLIKSTISSVSGSIPLVGDKIKKELQAAIDPLLADSKPKVEGNGAITIETAKLATAQTYSIAEAFFSEAQYGTGEHVIAGLVNETPITPTYQLDVNGVKFSYGEIISMGDFYEDFASMDTASATELTKLKSLIERSRKYYEGKVIQGKPVGTDPSDDDWQGATNKRYLKLAEENFSHFAPSDTQYLSFTSGKTNHKKEWEKYHAKAIDIMREGNKSRTDKALAVNAFGDHFLTDGFAAGHLVNKDDLAQYFKSLVMSGGKVNADGDKMFGNIAAKSFTGPLQATFSNYETVEWKGVVFRPNINSKDRFKALLIGIMEKEPDVLGKTLIAKLIHDALNRYPGGVEVTNMVGDKWHLTGDDTLNATNLDIIRKAVKQSIRNLSDSVKDSSPVTVFYKKVWDLIPRPTAASVTNIKNVIRTITNPLGTEIVNGADRLLQKNYGTLLEELVKRNVLKKA